MPNQINTIMDESIRFELLASALYLLFQHLFPMDADFWWTLALEEKNHAAVIASLKKSFSDPEDLPRDIFIKQTTTLEEGNASLEKLIEICETDPPSRQDAFRMALEIEESSVEKRYQEVMTKEYPDVLMRMVQELNRNDKDHAQRIRAYMTEQGIPVS